VGEVSVVEQYDRAAVRHYQVADLLEREGETDDAAYHYGLVGENALKHALVQAGVWAAWQLAGQKRGNTPMGKHLPNLTNSLQHVIGDIQRNASGRHGAALNAVVSDPTFAGRFQGWCIDIRYADDGCTPVAKADCQRWANDADHLFNTLVHLR
jgi:hypothetical protein